MLLSCVEWKDIKCGNRVINKGKLVIYVNV